MPEPLLDYYGPELLFLRGLVEEFAARHKIIAQRLLLEINQSADSHVERLIQSAALLNARVRRRIDDEYPEITDALLEVLYPHFRAPVPSLGVAHFELDPTRTLGHVVERHAKLRTGEIAGVPCRYRTAYPAELWPLNLLSASFQPPPFSSFAPGVAPPGAAAVLRLRFECAGPARFPDLPDMHSVRLYLDGEDGFVSLLYEYLFDHALGVVFRPRESPSPENPVVPFLPEQALAQVGFAADEALFPLPPSAPLGYRLLNEFFTFPAKFFFVDVNGWSRLARAGFDRQCEVAVFFGRTDRRLEQGVSAENFLLGCAPVVNLFNPEPVAVAVIPGQSEYRLVPDEAAPHGYEVYRVDGVANRNPATNVSTRYEPFHAISHEGTGKAEKVYWYTERQASLRENDRGTEVSLRLVDLALEPRTPAEPILAVETTCTNRDLPAQLAGPGGTARLELEAAAPLSDIRWVRPPTATLRPPHARGRDWRLVSHFTLNHLSLTDTHEGLEALRSILRLYQVSAAGPGDPSAALTQNLIDALARVASRRIIGRIADEVGTDFGRGLEVVLEFDEDRLGGTSVYLFASVLERFLAHYVSTNSFCQTEVRLRRGGLLRRWPPRPGQVQPL